MAAAAPVYLFTGPEFGLRNEAVKQVQDSMKKKYGTLDVYSYYASENDMGEVLTTLQSVSLFTAATCVVLHGAETIKSKDDISRLAQWADAAAKNGDDASCLILIADEVSVDSKLDKLVPGEHRKIFWEMFENRKLEWLHGFFRKNGYELAPGAAELILELVENNTEALSGECSMLLANIPPGSRIRPEDVEKMLSHNRTESPFTLFDAMADFEKSPQERLTVSLGILQKLMLSKGYASGKIIAGLTSCFRKLVLWHSLYAGGQSPDDFMLKTKGFGGSTIKKQYQHAARIWSSKQASAVLALLSAASMDIRSAGAVMEECQMQQLLYAVIMKNGRSCLLYI